MQQNNNSDLSLHAGLSRDDPPPFHKMDEYKFQELCAELYAHEAGITTCNVFGDRGQEQLGIDTIAYCRDAGSIEVGQCKRYETLTKAIVEEATNEFFRHLPHWKSQGVRKFVLFTSCRLSDKKLQTAISEQIKLFAAEGITYEAWSSQTLVQRLRPYSGIVGSYLHPSEYWIGQICGTTGALVSYTISAKLPGSETVIASQRQVDLLRNCLKSGVSDDLDEIIELLRSSKKEEAFNRLRAIRDDLPKWTALDPIHQARCLRVEASFALEVNDLELAASLADDAKALFPSDKQHRLRAIIAREKFGVDAALLQLQNPDEPETFQLKAAFLVESGRFDEAISLLAGTESTYPAGRTDLQAEAFRILALAHLRARRIDQAEQFSRKAFDLKPDWEAVQIAVSVIDYWATVNPAMVSQDPLAWPSPVDWDWISRSSDSLAKLNRACATWSKLLANANLPPNKRDGFRLWQLACTASIPNFVDEAAALAKVALKDSPANVALIAWVFARSLPLDLANSAQALRKQFKKPSGVDVNSVISLVACYLHQGKVTSAHNALRKFDVATNDDEKQALLTWEIQVLVRKDAWTEIIKLVPKTLDEAHFRSLRLLAKGKIAKTEAQIDKLLEEYAADWAATQHPGILSDAAEYATRKKRFAFIVQIGSDLLLHILNQRTVFLVSAALYNSGQPGKALEVLNQHAGVFCGDMPTSVSELRVRCLREAGDFSQAIAEARSNATKTATVSNLLTLFDCLVYCGDFDGAVAIAHQLLLLDNIASDTFLRLSKAVDIRNRDLAIRFWNKAIAMEVPDAQVSFAVYLGFELGQDAVLATLLGRMGQLARRNRGHARMGTIAEFVKQAQARGQSNQMLVDSHNSAQLPGHLVAAGLNAPLVNFYHTAAVQNLEASSFAEKSPIFVRHGGRQLPKSQPGQPARISTLADLSALFVAYQFDFLSDVESFVDKIYMANHTIPALTEMVEKLKDNQPALIRHNIKVLDLIRDQKLFVFSSQSPEVIRADLGNAGLPFDVILGLQLAKESGGKFLTYIPIQAPGATAPIEVPADYKNCVISTGDVFEALFAKGSITRAQLEQARTTLLGPVNAPTGNSILAGQAIYCRSNILSSFALTELLPIIANEFKVSVDEEWRKVIVLHVKASARNAETSQWINGLIQRLSSGLTAGKYIALPTLQPGPLLDRESLDLGDKVLCELLGSTRPANDCELWTDDRFLNGFRSSEVLTMISSQELLYKLRDAGPISTAKLFQILTEMRMSNLRYLEVTSEEILHHIDNSDVGTSSDATSKELNVLRQYVASAIENASLLQRPGAAPQTNPHGEMAWILRCVSATVDSICAIWASNERDVAIGKSEWLLREMFLDYGMAVEAWPSPSSHDSLPLLSITTAATFFTSAMTQIPKKGEKVGKRREYFEWIFWRVHRFQIDVDQSFLPRLAESIALTVNDLMEARSADVLAEHMRLLLAPFHLDLPEPLKEELSKDERYCRQTGVQYQRIATIGKVDFAAADFNRALADSLLHGEAVIKTVDKSIDATFRKQPDGTVIATIVGHGKFHFVGDTIGLQLQTEAERLAFLSTKLSWFDCAEQKFKELAVEISAVEDPVERQRLVELWQGSSIGYFLEMQPAHLKVDPANSFRKVFLPTTLARFSDHYRVPTTAAGDQQSIDVRGASALAITTECGLAEAIIRYGRLPAVLPTSIVDAAITKPANEFTRLVKSIIREMRSPVSLAHLIYLICRYEKDGSTYLHRLARRLLGLLIRAGVDEKFEQFLAVLAWYEQEVILHRDVPVHSSRIDCIWSLGSASCAALLNAKVDPRWVKAEFVNRTDHIPAASFLLPKDEWDDVAIPHRLQHTRLLFSLLSYVCGAEAGAALVRQVGAKLRALAFVNDVDGVPKGVFLKSAVTAPNVTSSFLDTWAGAFLAISNDDSDAPGNLELIVAASLASAVDDLSQDRSTLTNWGVLYGVFGADPIPVELATLVNPVFEKLNLAKVWKTDPLCAGMAAMTWAIQIGNGGFSMPSDGVNNSIRDFARAVHDSPSDAGEIGDVELRTNLLLEVIYQVSIREGDAQGRINRLCELSRMVLVEYPQLLTQLKRVAIRMTNEIPRSLSGPLWKLLVKLRAS